MLSTFKRGAAPPLQRVASVTKMAGATHFLPFYYVDSFEKCNFAATKSFEKCNRRKLGAGAVTNVRCKDCGQYEKDTFIYNDGGFG